MRKIRTGNGFTLIELLVVIAIIAILSAILFPVFTRVKQSAATSKCLGNVKQWSAAIQTYMGDYDGRFPWAEQWNVTYPPPFSAPPVPPPIYEVLGKYVGKSEEIRWCPMARLPKNDWLRQPPLGPMGWSYSYFYGYNMFSFEYEYYGSVMAPGQGYGVALAGYTLSDVRAPSRKPLISESGNIHPVDSNGAFTFSVAYVDGHARARVCSWPADITESYTYRNGRVPKYIPPWLGQGTLPGQTYPPQSVSDL